MTPQKINEAIQKFLWHYIEGGAGLTAMLKNSPNFFLDLNAMAEAEKFLTDDQWIDYATYIKGSIPCVGPEKELIHSPAAQRAEAFLKTIGKWKETQS